MKKKFYTAIGLMSGTSMDGVDLSVIKSVVKSNENRSNLLLKRVYKILNNKVKNKKICLQTQEIVHPVV